MAIARADAQLASYGRREAHLGPTVSVPLRPDVVEVCREREGCLRRCEKVFVDEEANVFGQVQEAEGVRVG
jgi:hypothetical protein